MHNSTGLCSISFRLLASRKILIGAILCTLIGASAWGNSAASRPSATCIDQSIFDVTIRPIASERHQLALVYQSSLRASPISELTRVSSGYGVASADLLERQPAGTLWAYCIVGESQLAARLSSHLAEHDAQIAHPAWSPNDTWLAFVMRRGQDHQLWVISADGSTLRRIDRTNVNLFAQGQFAGQIDFRRGTRVPYSWNSKGTRLLFASPTHGSLSPAERVSRYLLPQVFDSDNQANAYSIYANEIADARRFFYESQLFVADVSQNSRVQAIGSAEEIYHLEFIGSDHVLIGRQTAEGREFFVERAQRAEAATQVVSVHRLPVSDRDQVIIHSVPTKDRLDITLVTSGACEEAGPTNNLRVRCATSTKTGRRYLQVQSSERLARVRAQGDVEVLEVGRAEQPDLIKLESRRPVDSIARWTPFVSGSSNQIYSADGRIIWVVEQHLQNGLLAGFRVVTLDTKSGEQRVVIDDPNNKVNVVRFGPIIAPQVALVELGDDAGRFFLARLDFESGRAERLQPSQMTSLSFSDFKSVDLSYARSDGVKGAGRLFLPTSTRRAANGKLPLVVWHYPLHFDSPNLQAYEEMNAWRESKYESNAELTYVGNWLPLAILRDGFAVLHYPDVPLFGVDNNEGYGTFKDQLVSNADAIVRAAELTGNIDATRVAVAGHSRGGGDSALMLAYTDLFRTGIAVSGSMNRMLMPHGGQYEDRPMWKAMDAYMRNSASVQARFIDEPILMIHGNRDPAYAAPAVSRSLYEGIETVGGSARLVRIPYMSHEPHTPRERLIINREVTAWLEKLLDSSPIQLKSEVDAK